MSYAPLETLPKTGEIAKLRHKTQARTWWGRWDSYWGRWLIWCNAGKGYQRQYRHVKNLHSFIGWKEA